MKTMFTMGMFGGHREGFWMGQDSTVSQSQRNAMVTKIQTAIDKIKAHDDWTKNHPNLEQDLGADYSAYQTVLGNLNALATNATLAYQKFASTDPATWQAVTAQEWNDAETWSMFAGQLYDIILRHPTGGTKPIAAKPGAAPVPAEAGVSPLLVGAGVLAVGVLALAALS